MTDKHTKTVSELILKAIFMATVVLFLGLIVSFFLVKPAKGQSFPDTLEEDSLLSDDSLPSDDSLSIKGWQDKYTIPNDAPRLPSFYSQQEQERPPVTRPFIFVPYTGDLPQVGVQLRDGTIIVSPDGAIGFGMPVP